jgi:hypothetical protein
MGHGMGGLFSGGAKCVLERAQVGLWSSGGLDGRGSSNFVEFARLWGDAFNSHFRNGLSYGVFIIFNLFPKIVERGEHARSEVFL